MNNTPESTNPALAGYQAALQICAPHAASLQLHPMKTQYRSTSLFCMFLGGVECGRAGFAAPEDRNEFAEGFNLAMLQIAEPEDES